MSELKEGTKVKVKTDHAIYPGKEGFFRFMAGKEKDCSVCSDHPVANGGWNKWFVVGKEDLEEVK